MVLRKDPVKDFDEIQHANFEAGFFPEFARHALLKGFSEFERAARDGPLAKQGFAAPTDEQSPAIFDDYAADTDDGTLGIFA